jgi:long-subunit acyl-CoA synthetase (AMP-forming)
LNPYEKGEISLKSPFPFIGYWGEPEKTKMMIDDDGWIYTGLSYLKITCSILHFKSFIPGDYGYCDEEGNFYVIGRMSDFLKISGKMVSFL